MCATIRVAMLPRHSLELEQEAKVVEDAVTEVLRNGLRTSDKAEGGRSG